jgi:hypothetical protein
MGCIYRRKKKESDNGRLGQGKSEGVRGVMDFRHLSREEDFPADRQRKVGDETQGNDRGPSETRA